MDQAYSFPSPTCVHLAPPATNLPKSRAKSMSSEEAPAQRKHFHSHRRSAAVSEDLRGVVIPTIKPVSPSKPVENSPAKASEDRKVAFAAPPKTPNPESPRSAFSPRSPFRSPRRRTLSVFVDDEPPCIDLDEAMYSKTLHRRTESLPVANGLHSPFLPPPRPHIEPVIEEEEHSQVIKDSPEDRNSGESERSLSSGEHSIDSKKAKRFSFLRSLSPRLRAASPPPISSRVGSPRLLSPKKLRDIPSVSSLSIPDMAPPSATSLGFQSELPNTPLSDSFALGEPGPVYLSDKKKRWSLFRRQTKLI